MKKTMRIKQENKIKYDLKGAIVKKQLCLLMIDN